MNHRENFCFFGRALLLCCKRQLRLPAFRGSALALLALTGGFLLLCPEPRGASAEIGLLFDGSDSSLAAACAPLAEETGLPFRFYRPGEEEAMRRAVLTGALHCGYLLDPAADPPVTVYETDGSFLRPVADELVFGALFEWEAPSLAKGLIAGAGGDAGQFAPGGASPMTPVIETARGAAKPETALNMRPLLFAVLVSLFLFFALFGGLFSPGDAGAFAALESVRPGAARAALLADALACALLQGALLGLLLLSFPALRGAAPPAALPLLVLAAAALRQGASGVAARFPRVVLPLLLPALCWAFLSVCFSGALLDPRALGPIGALRYLSPAWLLAQLPL